MIQKCLAEAVGAGLFPGAAYAFGDAESVHVGAVGSLTFEPGTQEATTETPYDLASLTKVLCTTCVCLHAVRSGQLSRECRVSGVVPEFRSGEVTVAHLLRHDSGLPAYLEPHETWGPSEVISRCLSTQPVTAPGEEMVYSCVGFVVIAQVLERALGAPLDVLFGQLLGWTGLRFGPVVSAAPTGAPTGHVHDPLARAQGGVSGNAGLFGTAQQVGGLVRNFVRDEGEFGLARWGDWVERQPRLNLRGLGWDMKSPEETSAGRKFSAASFGHTGFTGTSVWCDPVSRRWAVLLSNATLGNPDRAHLRKVRSEFADLTLTDPA